MTKVGYEVIGQHRVYKLPTWVVASIQKHYMLRMPQSTMYGFLLVFFELSTIQNLNLFFQIMYPFL